jgi:LuxR family transcriptional regulator, maltose regulon positive regulatory protein
MANSPSPAIIETKLIPPQPASTWLARPHLLTQLERLRASKLALLLAPAGAGKTTLLAQWVSHLMASNALPTAQTTVTSRHIAVSWLTLEAADNEPARFFYYLLAAIKRAAPDFQGYLFSHLDGDEAIGDAMVDGLLDQLAALPCELIIVLDDAQYIDAQPIANALKRMLQMLPNNCHLVWCSRNLPPFGLSALKLAQSLWQLTHEQLRFSQQDIVALNTALSGAAISNDDSRHLHDITEGWIAGIKLALLTNHDAEALGTSLREFNGAHHDVMDYLADAVLSQLDVDRQTFLLGTSILSRLHSTLCDHVLDRSDSSAQLQWLTANQLFIQPLDATHQWLRYHALFREFLENRLRVKSPEQLPLLHARASTWFLQQQDFDSALQHAQASNDAQLWVHTLAVAWNEWIKQGEFNRILHWSETLDDTMLDDNTQVLSPMIAALIFARRFNQAAYYLERLADAARQQTMLLAQDGNVTAPKNIHDDPGAAVQFLRDMLELFQNDNAFRGNRELSLRDPQRGTDLYSFTLAMRAYYLLLNHDFAAAMRQADSARVYLQTAGQSYLASYATLIQILVDRAEGRMLDALTRTENAYKALRDARNPEWVNIATAMASVRYEQNQLDDAAELCRELLPHLSTACATEVVTAVYSTLARVQFARGAGREAHALLNHVSRILALGHYDRFTSQIVFEKARMAYAGSDQRELDLTARNARLLERFRSGEWRKPRSYDECWQRHGQALVYCLFARRALDDARGVLENLLTSADRAGCTARYVTLQAMLALCFDMQQQGAQAQQCLQLAIDRGGWVCFNRSVFDEAVGIAQLLNSKFITNTQALPGAQKRGLEIPETFIDLFHDVLMQAAVTPHQQLWTEPLTAKEAEILEFLVAGLSNKAISERAGIAVTTTKWHLKNIYGKLRVQNRMQALQKLEQT